MVKQLGIPLTLSFADLRWPELFPIISRIQEEKILVKKRVMLYLMMRNVKC